MGGEARWSLSERASFTRLDQGQFPLDLNEAQVTSGKKAAATFVRKAGTNQVFEVDGILPDLNSPVFWLDLKVIDVTAETIASVRGRQAGEAGYDIVRRPDGGWFSWIRTLLCRVFGVGKAVTLPALFCVASSCSTQASIWKATAAPGSTEPDSHSVTRERDTFKQPARPDFLPR